MTIAVDWDVKHQFKQTNKLYKRVPMYNNESNIVSKDHDPAEENLYFRTQYEVANNLHQNILRQQNIIISNDENEALFQQGVATQQRKRL